VSTIPRCGHKPALAVEMESQLISAVEVPAGDAGDQEKALASVPQSERAMEAEVVETVGGCAYGGGPTRRAFAEEERILTAKVPASHNGDCFPARLSLCRRRSRGPIPFCCDHLSGVSPCDRNASAAEGRDW
jgi:hypothetical protein